jgi:hypothetical protein
MENVMCSNIFSMITVVNTKWEAVKTSIKIVIVNIKRRKQHWKNH